MEPRSSAGRKKDVAGRVGDAIDQIERVANLKTACRRGDRMSSRREFITLLGSAAAWPFMPRALTPEQEIIGWVARSKGHPLTQAETFLVLEQARAVGELD